MFVRYSHDSNCLACLIPPVCFLWVWVWVWDRFGCLQGEGQSDVAVGEAWLELDARLGVLTRLLVAAQLKEAGSAVRVDRVLRLVEGDGLRVVHGRLARVRGCGQV